MSRLVWPIPGGLRRPLAHKVSASNWLLGLPCWLLGCKLAERSDSLFSPVSDRAIWIWRLSVWFTSGVCLGLRFHSPIGFPHTLNYFAILSYFWLQQEVRYFRHANPPRILEWGGKWSYSLYLLHVPANGVYNHIFMPNLGFIINWFLRVGWTLGCSYVFYLLVEKPSHAFARWVGRRGRKAAVNDHAAESNLAAEKPRF